MDLSPTAVKRRLGLNLLAGIGSQVVGIVQQMVSVPILLWAWGPEAYGVWMALFSVGVSITAFADFGYVGAATSDIGMARASGDLQRTLAVFQSGLVFVFCSALLALGIGLMIAWVLPVGSWLRVPPAHLAEVPAVLTLFILSLPLLMFSSLCFAAFRGEGKMAQGVFYNYFLCRLFEVGVVLVAAVSGAGLIGAAAAGLGARLVSAVTMGVLARRQIGWVRYGVAHASWKTIEESLRPALAHMVGPTSGLISVAGVNMLVSVILGPSAVTVVSIIRTLGNLSFQVFYMLVAAVWPEISSLVGAKQWPLVRQVILRTGRVCFWLVLAACGCLLAGGGPFLRLWTGGKVQMVWGLLGFQLLAVVLACIWRIPSATLLATNRNGRMAVFQLIGVLVSLLVTGALLRPMGTSAVGVGMVAMESIVVLGVLRRSLAAANVQIGDYVLRLLCPPTFMEIRNLAWRGWRPQPAAVTVK